MAPRGTLIELIRTVAEIRNSATTVQTQRLIQSAVDTY